MKLSQIYRSTKEWFNRHKAINKIKKRSRRFYGKHYSDTVQKTSPKEKTAIIIFDGKMHHGGLADRLRGILSAYSICKDLGITFKLYFDHPFNIRDFLSPNEYDWRIDAKDISYNAKVSEPIVAIDANGQVFADYMKSMIEHTQKKQIHIYTNSPFIFSKDKYSELFHELFSPKAIILNETVKYKELLSPKYISISTRFMNLLGDFNERNSNQLDESEQKKLIDGCMVQIECLHDTYPDHKVFVASDSYTFLCRANEKEYVTISGGRPIHVDNCHKEPAI